MLKIIIASGPVIVENNKVLLNKHGDDDFWKFCGGRVEDFEIDIEETAKREVKEEMGLEIEILNDLPYFFYTKKEKDGEKISVVLVHFLAKRLSEIKPDDDIKEWAWLDLDSLEKENLAPNVLATLRFFNFLK